MEDAKEQRVDESEKSSPQEEEAIKKKYGGIIPKKPPLISKDHERAYFDLLIGLLESKVLTSQKDHLKPLGQNYSPHSSKHDTESLLVLPQMVKMGEVLLLRIQLPMNESAFGLLIL